MSTTSTPTHAIQSAINEAERVIDPLAGRGYRVEIYQHELATLVKAANECIQNRIEEEERKMLRHGI